jgi:hypothetical protein
MEIIVDTRELVALERRLALAGKATNANKRKMLSTIGSIVGKMAIAMAPRSMTKAEYVSMLKGGKTKRSTSSFTSGSLKSSITTEVKKDSVEIGVPSNSKAGRYAEKIHDEKGKSWKKLGWQNDGLATDKYIFKAEEKTKDQYMKAVDGLVDKIIKAI